MSVSLLMTGAPSSRGAPRWWMKGSGLPQMGGGRGTGAQSGTHPSMWWGSQWVKSGQHSRRGNCLPNNENLFIKMFFNKCLLSIPSHMFFFYSLIITYNLQYEQFNSSTFDKIYPLSLSFISFSLSLYFSILFFLSLLLWKCFFFCFFSYRTLLVHKQ